MRDEFLRNSSGRTIFVNITRNTFFWKLDKDWYSSMYIKGISVDHVNVYLIDLLCYILKKILTYSINKPGLWRPRTPPISL